MNVDLESKRIVSRPTLSIVVRVRRVLWCERQRRGPLSLCQCRGGYISWHKDILSIFFPVFAKWNVRVIVDLEVPKRIVSRPSTLSTVVRVRRVLWCERQKKGPLSLCQCQGGYRGKEMFFQSISGFYQMKCKSDYGSGGSQNDCF
jgi:hypothetical protein